MHGKSESLDELDEVSMTALLVGFAHNGFVEETIQIFGKIVKGRDWGWFGVDTSLRLGTQIHALVIKKKFCDNTYVNNGL